MEKEQLVEIANTEMPFGKYKGRRLIDLPEEYLLWFARKDEFPAGRLGELMAITLLIKTEGLTQLVQPLTGYWPSGSRWRGSFSIRKIQW